MLRIRGVWPAILFVTGLIILAVYMISEGRFSYGSNRWKPSPTPDPLSHSFNYTILHHPNVQTCKLKTKLLIIIITAPSETEERKAWRDSILMSVKTLPHISYAFIVGSTSVKSVNTLVETESKMRGDLILGNFEDSYESLTTKSLYSLKWTKDNCPQADYMLKVDGDVFLNIANLQTFIKSLNGAQNMIAGNILRGSIPRHGKRNRWRSEDWYGEPYYPTFVSGMAYIISSDLLPKIYDSAMLLPYFRLEDVFITGLCPSMLIQPVKYVKIRMVLNAEEASAYSIRHSVAAHSYTCDRLREVWSSQSNGIVLYQSYLKLITTSFFLYYLVVINT